MFRKLLSIIRNLSPFHREISQIQQTLNSINANIYQLNNEIAQIKNFQITHYLDARFNQYEHHEDTRRLQRYSFQVNSQNGEDGIIHEIFKRIGTTNKVFAEIGIGDGTINNTAFLLMQGWSGFWIDAKDDFLTTLGNGHDLQDNCLKWVISFINKENIIPIFKELNIPEEFDLLSLDIDQNTYYIWETLSNYRPRVVVVEYNAAIPPDINWKVQYNSERIWDQTQNFGASLKALEVLGNQLGYNLVGCDFLGINAFFVRNDLVDEKFADPFTAENHYEPPRYSFVSSRGHKQTILDKIIN